jgi:hypothetical protein
MSDFFGIVINTAGKAFEITAEVTRKVVIEVGAAVVRVATQEDNTDDDDE